MKNTIPTGTLMAIDDLRRNYQQTGHGERMLNAAIEMTKAEQRLVINSQIQEIQQRIKKAFPGTNSTVDIIELHKLRMRRFRVAK